MKLTILNVHSSSIEQKTWMIANLGNFMYFKSLWLRMGDEKNFPPKPCKWNQLIFFSQNYSKVIQHGHLEKNGLQHKCLTKSKVRTICSNSPTLQGTQNMASKTHPIENKTSPLLHLDS